MKNDRGFTVVELLITLFVAAAFLVSGYQLFNAIIKDGGQTRAEAKASNAAYDYLRRYSSSATNPCVYSKPLDNSSVTIPGIAATLATVEISCPYSSQPSVSKIDVTILYNNPQQTVKYTTLVNGVGYDADSISPVGLVGWWKFNGNATTSVGTANGTVTGATLTSGQDGQVNTAYNFSTACCQYIATSALPALPSSISISAWIYPVAYPSERAAIVVNPAADGYYFSLNSDASLQSYWYGTSSPGYHTTPAGTIPLNQWSFTTVTWSGSQVKLYINGTLRTTVSTGGGGAASGLVHIGAQASSSSRQFAGKLDDIRIYSRTLTDLEVSNLYAEGAE